jgi:adenine-specific DNA-methyltransferase
MTTNAQTLIQSLSGALRRLSVMRIAVDTFKTQFLQLLDSIDDKETEEFHKNLVSEFLKETYYKNKNFINTKGRNDLVIHNGETPKTFVGVIIEAKKPTNAAEMPSLQNINVKAFHELILYYLRERITHKNLEIKHLVITNVYEWFIFDVQEIDRLFAQNKTFVQQYQDFLEGRLADSRTDFFYKQIAEPFIKNLDAELTFTHISLKDYETFARNNTPEDDKKLLELYKIFAPEHLLKLPFVNDSNTLDKGFYFELLHVMGLKEVQEGGKKLIQRNPEKERNTGSILEETILRVESLQKLDRITNLETYGNTREEQLFGVGLELTITWINRMLFLKLLEAQLLSYHKGDKHYAFLSAEKFRCASGLDVLFFDILAKEPENRHPDTKLQYEKIPYLNSSLFEITELEHQTVLIGNLHTDKILPLYSQTVLKNRKGQKQTEELRTLDYLFAFLDAYDFGAEGKGEVQEENKPLITASVLGLVFEKINGYQDGSFFTPGFITMYMCKETLQRAVIQKFNEVKNWNCKTITDLSNKIEDLNEANNIMNSLKICDPAVGSGHFLVSVLNEMIAIKSELKILLDREGIKLKDYKAVVENDELMIFDLYTNEYFKYTINNIEKLRVQEAIFHEKQTIIENCLFGVDINSNSVKICRLRLWIELLKSAYYKRNSKGGLTTQASSVRGLETLPNIDINIKCGNSLISKLQLNDSLNQFNNAQRQTIRRLMPDYKKQVSIYKGVRDKDAKRKTVALLESYRQTFLKMFNPNDADYLDYKALENKWVNAQLSLHQTAESLEKLQAEFEIAKERWEAKTQIYRNAFEWRFEFPEVLDNEGNFVGFDVVVGNPPYIPISSKNLAQIQANYLTYTPTGDMYALFVELGQNLIKDLSYSSMIISNKWLRASYGQPLRNYLISKTNPIQLVDFGQNLLFEKAIVHTNIILLKKELNKKQLQAVRLPDGFFNDPKAKIAPYIEQNLISNLQVTDDIWNIIEPNLYELKTKIESKFVKFSDWNIDFYRGILTGLNEAFIIDESTKNTLVSKDRKNKKILKPILRGRDTRRYYCNYANLWLINSHNGYDDVPPIDVLSDYPTIFDYLKSFEKPAINRFDKGEHWTNLRSCAYINKFEEPKIIFSEIVSEPQFYYDEKGYYPEATVFFISGEKLKYLTALLNSKAVTFFFKTFYMGGELVGKIRYKKVFLEQVPLPVPTKKQEQQVEKLVNKILAIKENNPNADASILETEIDTLVYKLYDLTAEEIKLVENGTK